MGHLDRLKCICATLLVGTVTVGVPAASARAGGTNVLVNGDAESGDVRGWTSIEGDFAVFDRTDGGWPGPAQGVKYFAGGHAKRSVLEQVVAVPKNAAGGVVELRCMLRGGGKDRVHAELELLGAGGSVLHRAATVTVVPKKWKADQVRLDVTDRVTQARVRLVSERFDGKFSDAYVDDVRLVVRPPLDQVLDPRNGAALADLEIAALTSLARTSEDDHVVEAAADELARRGAHGWKEVAALVHEMVRKDRSRLAGRLIARLADGPEEERKQHLRRLRKVVRDEAVQRAVTRALEGGATGTVKDLLENPGAEIANLRGWTMREGGFRSEDRRDGAWPGPTEGDRYFGGGNASRSVAEQRVAVPAGMQGGVAELRCSLFANQGDRIGAALEVLDADGKVLTLADTPFALENAWTAYSLSVPIPSDGVFLRVRLIAVRYAGRYIDGWADGLELSARPQLDQLTDAATGKRLSELPIAVLSRMARSVGDQARASAAARELSTRDVQGWQALGQVIRQRVRDGMITPALEAVAFLGEGTQDGRRRELRRLYNSLGEDSVREAIVLALARFYPKEADLVIKRLHAGRGDVRALLHKLDGLGVFDEDIEPCLADPVAAWDAYMILRRRGVQVPAPRLAVVARGLADQAIANFRAQELLGSWAGRQDWELARALAELLDTSGGDTQLGAHLLLMQITGDSLDDQTDVWVKRLRELELRGTPPPVSSPGYVNAAVTRGARYLRGRLLADGHVGASKAHRVGATSLAIYALRASGVPRNDPAIEKALADTVLPGLETRHTYTLGCAALALARIDPRWFGKELESVRDRLVDGQKANGSWGYTCRPAGWEGKHGRSDHSNMQYAILGLRALRRNRIDVPRATWERAEKHLREAQGKSGPWNYHRGQKANLSMTAAGLSSLVICLEALHGKDAPKVIAADEAVKRGIVAMGSYLFRDDGFGNASIYRYFGLERACILTSTRGFSGLDWYRAGVDDLLATQQDNGAWHDLQDVPVLRTQRYGAGVETAWALLFLKRAVTPVESSSDRGHVDVPGLGPSHFRGALATAIESDFVRSWRISDRIAPFLSWSEFVPVSAARVQMLSESAVRAPLVTSKTDYVDLVQLRGGRNANVAVYAARRIRCDAPTRVKVLYGSDDAFRCWLDGELQTERTGPNGHVADAMSFLLDLPEGASTLLVEVSQGAGHFGFSLRFERPDGTRLRLNTGGQLVVAPAPPAQPK